MLFIEKRARGVWEFYPVTELLASGTLSALPVCVALAAFVWEHPPLLLAGPSESRALRLHSHAHQANLSTCRTSFFLRAGPAHLTLGTDLRLFPQRNAAGDTPIAEKRGPYECGNMHTRVQGS